ncbi:MAG: DNA starvation/stationary phase protection protein [Aureispira sp.]|nr:DNA starvation/stationary phase protection protein [Aureispira sp.]
MQTLNAIGLNKEKTTNLAIQLNELLANYSIFYMNVRGLHWNIKGDKFFELHVKFEELYDNLFLKIDELAERILTLGHTPTHAYSDYLQQSSIEEARNISDGNKALNNILASFQTIIIKQRAILELAGDANDEGTNALMSDYIREQEKLVWMYSAFLG